jgi:hypothetical protein
LGNQFKFGSINKQVTYEQSREIQAISEANRRTRARFGGVEQAIPTIRFPKTGVPFSKEWYYHEKSRGKNGLPEISFGIIDKDQTRNLRIDERATRNEKITKETSGHLDHHISDHRNSASSILGGLASLLDGTINNEPEKREKNKEEKKKRGLSM